MRSLHLAMAGVAACFVAELARAAEDGIYIGAGRGQVETDDTLGLGEVYDDQDTVNKLILGWRPIDWFAVEASYFDLGAVTLSQSQPALAPYRLEQDGWNVFAAFMLELGVFDLYAKGGIVKSSADLTQSVGAGQASSVDKDTDFGWGAGAQVRIRKVAARIEYEEFHISNGDRFDFPKMVSLGITWTF
ncbi:MAG TPA: outer membrane beta-barrel protein [Gammaproteobacteria bacterium]